jgi:drug/metabolite transporter (DMT)-like permease
VTLWSQAIGLAAAVPVLLVIGPSFDWRSLLNGCLAGIGVGISLVLLYSSTRYLFIGMSSAISAVVACVIPVAWGAFSHPLSLQEGLGVALCVGALAAVGRWRGDVEVSNTVATPALPVIPEGAAVGVAVAARPLFRERLEVLGVGAALASGVAMSVYYIALAGSSSRVQITEAIESRATASLLVTMIGLTVARKAIVPTRTVISGALPSGLFSIAAALCYATVVRSNTLSLIVPIVSLSPGVTIVVAWLALHERISRRQVAGLVLAMIGVIVVTA